MQAMQSLDLGQSNGGNCYLEGLDPEVNPGNFGISWLEQVFWEICLLLGLQSHLTYHPAYTLALRFTPDLALDMYS